MEHEKLGGRGFAEPKRQRMANSDWRNGEMTVFLQGNVPTLPRNFGA
ncbi:MAG: hypothetical protein DFNUSKGM_001167 [Candidatus Fervidibacter sacchari]